MPESVVTFGGRAKVDFVDQTQAYDLAKSEGVFLEGLGGTNDGVIGALAAVGLATTGDDGRIVQLGDDPDDLTGTPTVSELQQRGVEVRDARTEERLVDGSVFLRKNLRPNLRGHREVLYVDRAANNANPIHTALKLP